MTKTPALSPVLLLAVLFFSGMANASPPREGDSARDRNRVVLAPYAWALNMSGSIGLNGIDVPLDLQSTELLDGIKSGGMGYLQWHRGPGFFYLEGIQIDFGQKNFAPLFNQSVDASLLFVETGYGLTLDIDAPLPGDGNLRISPYIGGRVIKINVDVNGPLLHQTVKEDWVDPVLGAIIQAPLSRRFTGVAKIDAAGFNSNGSNYQSIAALVLYSVNDRWSLGAGYRFSAFEASARETGGVTMDLEGHGPMAGLQYSFY